MRPALGAGLVRFDWVHGGVLEPLFRPAPAGATPAVFDFASIVLLPWSNRVSGGGFEFEFTIIVKLDLPSDQAHALVAKAHQVCPYSNAFRNGAPTTARLAD